MTAKELGWHYLDVTGSIFHVKLEFLNFVLPELDLIELEVEMSIAFDVNRKHEPRCSCSRWPRRQPRSYVGGTPC
jgi:hypothetical protein